MLDPACGTGGFLVEAYTHLEAQVQTVEDVRQLQNESVFGSNRSPYPTCWRK